ncbi:MAG: hypothetical protein IBJ11_06930 [Phycisphaerales bacterium]|nr:hypothetical protein [Phycisphaerales bacterium]
MGGIGLAMGAFILLSGPKPPGAVPDHSRGFRSINGGGAESVDPSAASPIGVSVRPALSWNEALAKIADWRPVTDSVPVRDALSAAMSRDRRFADLPATAQLAEDAAKFVGLRLGWRTEADIERYIDWRLTNGYRLMTMAEMDRYWDLKYTYEKHVGRTFSVDADLRSEFIEVLKWERQRWPNGRAERIAAEPVAVGLSCGTIDRDPSLMELAEVSGAIASEEFAPPGQAANLNQWMVPVPRWEEIRQERRSIRAVRIAVIVETNQGRHLPIQMLYMFNDRQGRWILDRVALHRTDEFGEAGNLEITFF